MKIDQSALEAFKLTLPEDIREECFRWISTVYDVPKALFVIQQKQLQLGKISVPDWCKVLGMDGPQDLSALSFNMLTGVSDKDALQDKINPEIPLIIVEHEFNVKGKGKQTSTIVIDGNKRLRKAFLTGITHLKAYFIPKELAKLIKL